jgi:DNA polymerase-3 subunit delta'
VGKQRLALWLGQALLCERGPGEPCGACQTCRFTGELTHPDLHWFFPRPRLKDSDPAPADVRLDLAESIAERVKHGGVYPPPAGSDGLFVAAVRALVQQAAMSPALARRKVFVVGDAERMVPQEGAEAAANAFLKLLEEPPADTTLILTSSEPGALLPTIRSRVVCVRVPRLPEAEIRAFLADPLVDAALAKEPLPKSVDERVGLAGGAPGALVGGGELGAAVAEARRLVEAAMDGTRTDRLRLAFGQGAAKARGAFSDMLDALTAELHAVARNAALRGDERRAMGAARAMDAVEMAKARAAGNVSPQLASYELLRAMTAVLK